MMQTNFYPGENIHPSTLPENQNRVALHEVFHQLMLPEIGALLGKESYGEPPPGFERAWRVFIGTMLDGQFYFVCHIAESFKTAQAYNCGDSTIPAHPILLFGEPFHIETSIMNQIRQQFPLHHVGKVPVQVALAIQPRSAPSPSSPHLASLFSGQPIETDHYTVSVMSPVGTESLSFRANSFPLQFWTHGSRYQVIRTALVNEQDKASPNGELVAIYEQACQLEQNYLTANEQLKTSQKNRERKATTLAKEEQALIQLQSDSRVPAEAIQRKQQVVDQLKIEKGTLEGQVTAAQQALSTIDADINQFKETHFEMLPHSYREATFQLALDLELPNGNVIYKQYNGVTKTFESCTDEDRHIRYGNDVHIPYLNL